MVILGELGLLEGERSVKGTMAFVPQESWILSDTVRANVLMDKDMDKQRYDDVIEACCLDVVKIRLHRHNVIPIALVFLVTKVNQFCGRLLYIYKVCSVGLSLFYRVYVKIDKYISIGCRNVH